MQANFTYIVLSVCTLLALGLVWQETRRANRRLLAWRVLATLIAVASMACLVLPLTYQSKVDVKEQYTLALLTPGFDADDVNSMARLVTFDEEISKVYPRARFITPDQIDKNDDLHIFGYGLNDFDLLQLSGQSITFHPAKLPAGVSNLSYNSRLKAGEALKVQGTYINTVNAKVTLVLKALDTGVDSAIVAPNSSVKFSFTTKPKTIGKVLYTLIADKKVEGSLPVDVTPVKPLKVLMLSASPDFESKFLKNWLSQNGYGVVYRAAISKDKFSAEFINMAQFSLDRLSAATLAKFDLVVGDLSVLSSLSSAESAALRQEVTANGLGVVLKADSSNKSTWLQKGFTVDRPAVKEAPPGILNINGDKSNNKLNVSAGFIKSQNGTQPLVTDAQNHILANSSLVGSGKVVSTTLSNSFSWVLAGKVADYATLWSALLSNAARKSDAVSDGIRSATLPIANQPVTLTIKNSKTPTVNINGDYTAAIQHKNMPFEWDVLIRPESSGWQTVITGDLKNEVYVYPQDQWTAIQAAEKIAATKNYELLHSKPDIVTKQIQETVRIDVPKIYFYILLLAACTFLWVETKIS